MILVLSGVLPVFYAGALLVRPDYSVLGSKGNSIDDGVLEGTRAWMTRRALPEVAEERATWNPDEQRLSLLLKKRYIPMCSSIGTLLLIQGTSL